MTQENPNVSAKPPGEASESGNALATDAAGNANEALTDNGPPKIIKPRRRTVFMMMGVALGGILLVLWAWHLWPFSNAIVTTDDSYVRGQITVMAPQVNGYIAEVKVRDFEQVQAGQPLLQIDDRIYRERVRQAQAQLDSARAQLANADQTLAQNQAATGARRADLAAAQAEDGRASADEHRTSQLAASGAVSARDRDQARATARLAAANVLKAKAQIEIAEQTTKATQVSRAGLEAAVSIAQAQLALAQIDLDNTVIRAPRNGTLGEISVRLGQYVGAGSQLLFLVPDTLWVIANYKETQTSRIRIGQSASFSVDALDDAVLSATVQEISPATGSEFSVLRADNATGNFTKVVQRLPVRITIDPGQPLAQRLRPGMSVVTHVDTASDSR